MNFDERTLWSLALVLAAALAFKYLPRWQARSPFISASHFKAHIDEGQEMVILDVRTAREYESRTGRIPAAVNVAMGDLQARLAARARDLEALKQCRIIVYCHREGRAARSARILRDAGFSNVSVLKGGLIAWKRQGYPIERPTASSS